MIPPKLIFGFERELIEWAKVAPEQQREFSLSLRGVVDRPYIECRLSWTVGSLLHTITKLAGGMTDAAFLAVQEFNKWEGRQ